MPKIELSNALQGSGSRYPAPFDEPCTGRKFTKLGDAAGLTQFGVNLVLLPPGTWSSQRHWHSHEDEFVYVVAGEVVLVTDAGEAILHAGDSAGFKAGVRDGHHFQNRTNTTVKLVVIGSRNDEDHGEYPDIDLMFGPEVGYSAKGNYLHKDGTPY